MSTKGHSDTDDHRGALCWPAAPMHAQRGGGAAARAADCASGGGDRSDRNLGIGDQRGLAAADAAAPERRLHAHPSHRRPRGRCADTWDPARDEAAGEQCKGYTAAGITRMPGRIRISWQDDYTMKMELEAGSQTRLFHFRPGQPPAEPSWQGHSAADVDVHAPAAAERRTAGGHESSPAGILAQERRALERQHHA